ncbi:hypothetical protein [Novipirellula caenicola]|uniref:Uncharacterized protein n=1 Tax=Novipirellula caenicola TaxID=1536901 RepID=A0ABP9VU75_9BACT
MPEPLLYAKTFVIAMVASALFVLAITKLRVVSAFRLNLVCIIAIAIGVGIGFIAMRLQWQWPAASALDRFLTLVLPAVLVIESITNHQRVPDRIKWGVRFCFALAAARILIHQSVYLTDPDDGKRWQFDCILLLCAGMVTAVWWSLGRLSRRSQDTVSISLALCMSIQSAGVSVMLAGYIKGGAVAIPLTAAILGTALTAGYAIRRSQDKLPLYPDATIGISVVSLFSVLFIGHFFGRLSAADAMTLMIAPTLCWISEVPVFRNGSKWGVVIVRLVFVATPLMVVLLASKREFDRNYAPLVEKRGVNIFFEQTTPAYCTALKCSPLP